MKLKLWLILLAFVIGMVISYKTRTFTSFIFSAIILTGLFFVLFLIILKATDKFKHKKFSSFILTVFLCFLLAGIIFLTWFIVFANFGAGPTMLTVVDNPDFFHNIFTGKCEFRGYGSAYVQPWYIKQGCDLEKQELLDLAKESNRYNYVIHSCEDLCNSAYEYMHEQFCFKIFGSPYKNLTCADFVVCNNITCS